MAALCCSAARHGRVHVLDWLLDHMPDRMQPDGPDSCGHVLKEAARGCTLGVLQRLHARFFAGQQLSGWVFYLWLAGAARSPTPDWQAKVEWLEALGCPPDREACAAAASHPDALARLQWLVGRGYELGRAAAVAAAEAGHVEALQDVLAQGVELDVMLCAAQKGQLPVMQMLLTTVDAAITPEHVEAAAEGGHLHVVAWAAEQLGDELELTARLFRAAAGSGSWPLMRWLHEHGCPWDASVFAAAAGACSEEQLEWLVESGCPMGPDGMAYVTTACDWDLLALRCLRRLGCPFAADGGTFTAVVQRLKHTRGFGTCEAALRWLLDAGCPVDWAAAMNAAGNNAGFKSWLQEQQLQRGGRVF